MSHRHHSDRAATRDDRHDGCGAPYLVAGFSVAATALGTKRPLFPWIEFQSRRPTAAEMSAWYRRDPRAGVAIVCDAVSDSRWSTSTLVTATAPRARYPGKSSAAW